MQRVLFLFLSQLAVGSLALVALAPPEAGRTFFRVMGFVVLLFSLATLATAADSPLLWAGSALLVGLLVLYNVALWLDRPGLARFAFGLAALEGLALVIISALGYVDPASPWLILLPLNYLASSALLGSATTGMVLAHWYLAARRMPLQPLQRIVQVLIGSAVLMGLLAAAASLLGPQGIRIPAEASLPVPELTYGIFVGGRILGGILGPLVLGVMIWQVLHYRTTTAATGILYVTVAAVLFGQLLARYLLLATAIPW